MINKAKILCGIIETERKRKRQKTDKSRRKGNKSEGTVENLV